MNNKKNVIASCDKHIPIFPVTAQEVRLDEPMKCYCCTDGATRSWIDPCNPGSIYINIGPLPGTPEYERRRFRL